VVLTDDQQNPRSRPTKSNMIGAMYWLVKDAKPNDSLFFHYSGHGGQTKDLDGDEDDGYDEVIYPVDYKTARYIVDDLMHDIMVKPLPPGCRLTAIFDCCHSGSALDLPYMYSTEGKIKEPDLRRALINAVSYSARGEINAAIRSVTTSGRGAMQRARLTKTSPADVISLGACKDSQKSADAAGAMSRAFIRALTERPQQSYQELLMSMRTILSERHNQKPQLSSSHPIDTTLQFIVNEGQSSAQQNACERSGLAEQTSRVGHDESALGAYQMHLEALGSAARPTQGRFHSGSKSLDLLTERNQLCTS